MHAISEKFLLKEPGKRLLVDPFLDNEDARVIHSAVRCPTSTLSSREDYHEILLHDFVHTMKTCSHSS